MKDGDPEGHYHNNSRIEQGLLDFSLDRLGFFQVNGDLAEQGFQHASFLAGIHQVAIKIVEIQVVLGQRLGEGIAALHIGLDAENHVLELGFLAAVAHHVQGLHHGDAGLQHGA